MSAKVKLLIKNPAGSTSLSLEISPDASLAELHGLLAECYEGKPVPASQTLIFAGKVLKDGTVTIRKLIEKHEPFEGPHSFHLVVRKPQDPSSAPGPVASTSSAASSSSAPSTSAAAPSTPTPAPALASPSPAPPHPLPSSSAPASTPAEVPPTTTTTPPQPEAPQPQAPTAPQADIAASMYPYMYVNPIYAAAYQAAYAAALAASMQGGSMQSSGLGQQPMPMPYYMSAMYPPGYMSYAGSSAFQQQQQQQMHGMQMPFQYGAAAAPGAAPSMVAHIIQGGPNGPEIRIEGLPQDALGPVAMALANLRQRRGGPAAPAGGALPNNQVHVHMRPPRRPRGITLRISARTILQVLIFAMVLYQHFTWHRFIALIIGGLVLYLTSSWGPLRRLLANLQQPPAPPRPAAAAAAAAAGPLPAQQAAADAGAGGGAAAPPVNPAQPHRPRGILNELLVLVLGFITSLLPAWNYNPVDAAAFAAAQAIVAREDQRQQQEAAAGVDGGGGGIAAVGDAEAAAAAPVDAGQAEPPPPDAPVNAAEVAAA